MAFNSTQQAANLAALESLLRDMLVYPVDDETADLYGALKAGLLDYFGPRERARRRQFDVTRLGCSDNDLWIAATAKRHGLTLVSADTDFARNGQVVALRIETWWTPQAGKSAPR